MPMRVWPKLRPALAPGWTFTTPSASTRAWVIARRGKFTRKACGYVDDRVADRLRFPHFPSELGKRGNARLRPHTHNNLSSWPRLRSTPSALPGAVDPELTPDQTRLGFLWFGLCG